MHDSYQSLAIRVGTHDRPLAGKVAIVTGGSRGIGAGVARELAHRGAHVALTYATSAKGAQDTVKAIEVAGDPKAVAIQANGSDPEKFSREIVAETVKAFGNHIDIIVNNAATGGEAYLGEISVEHFHHIFYTNLLSPVMLIQESAKYMSRGGRIVNVSSTGARRAMPYGIMYAASKAALESITRSLAGHFGEDHGITVNAVNPGPVDTDLWTPKERTDAIEGRIVKQTLAGHRIGKVDDIVPIIAFLCDPGAKWITGNTTCANGGFILT